MEDDKSQATPPTAPEIGASPEATPAVAPTAIKTTEPVQDEEVITPKAGQTFEPAPVESSADGTIPPKKDFTPPKKPGHKKLWLFLLILFLLAGAAAWWFLLGKKAGESSKTTSTTVVVTKKTTANSYMPVDVAYAFRDATNNPFSIYAVSVDGTSKRVAADQKLVTSEYVVASDVNGANVVIATSKAIYVSTDSGKTYKSILTIGTSEQVTDIKFSTDGQKIVYGFLASAGDKNQVKTTSLTGSSTSTLFMASTGGVKIFGYSPGANKIVYSETCANCGDVTISPVLRDLKTGKTTSIASSTSVLQVGSVATNKDLTKVVYSTAAIDAKLQAQATGTFTSAPYTIYVFDTSTGKSSQAATFGTVGEKNPNGTPRSRQVLVGFVAGANTPYYTNDAQLYVVQSGSPNLIYEATKPIQYIPYVGSDTIVAGWGADTANFELDNYNVGTKKAVKIFIGDSNTVIFGVTTK